MKALQKSLLSFAFSIGIIAGTTSNGYCYKYTSHHNNGRNGLPIRLVIDVYQTVDYTNEYIHDLLKNFSYENRVRINFHNSGNHSTPDATLIHDMITFLNQLPQLTWLELSDYNSRSLIDDTLLTSLPDTITTLQLMHCNKITDQVFTHLPKSLATLCIEVCEPLIDGWLALIPFQITTLLLKGCNHITNHGIENLPEWLTNLHLHWCHQVTSLAGLPKNLTSLSLIHCVKISIPDEEIARLPQRLTEFSLSTCDLITDKTLHALHNSRPGLVITRT